MDYSSSTAGWLSFAATTIGLGGLISQASAINDKMDPFHEHRTVEYLGVWFERQAAFPWWRIVKPPLQGPSISANLSAGFCNKQTLHVVRVPLRPSGKAGWAVILSIFNIHAPKRVNPTSDGQAEKASDDAAVTKRSGRLTPFNCEWSPLEQQPLIRHQRHACITISRTTLVTMMCITNARVVFQYCDAAGFRAGYGSYSGQWYITWQIGQEAVVSFAPHDSHSAATDVYPVSFKQRVDRCIQMVCGIISSEAGEFQVAFCGRKPPGTYNLEHVAKGFPGAHGSRHLFNMMGGKVFEVDFMYARQTDQVAPPDGLVLLVPSTEKGKKTQFIIPKTEEEIIKKALDHLPWASLSWSIHRGLKDILVAYAKPVMDQHRKELADLLKRTCNEKPHLLDRRGWNPSFVRNNMGDMAASAILAGGGNSGDLVRVVTEIVLALVDDWPVSRLDEVSFWTLPEREFGLQGVVALTKLFVVEWSNEFDYQMYHDLPINLYFG
ncbi:hypothetical protein B0I35DRAFT_444749 [Stachybotrys elegans]|uniref:Uncharacterized protein n=1 Tax=Stachybotrys elegans TaxID=80388 RepID=A0A8K0SCZ8_9HYPO|nr:hypothetical protein B0I35DRAFT_444749 [Stachybotrys elegans]